MTEYKANVSEESRKTWYDPEYQMTKTQFFEWPYYAEYENNDPLSPKRILPYMSNDRALEILREEIKYKKPESYIFTNYMAKVSVILYPKEPYNQQPILMTKTFRPQVITRRVEQRLLYFQNHYTKMEYKPSYSLWMNRWNY